MKIIQTREEVNDFMRRREKADADCLKCPECGSPVEYPPIPKIDKAASIFFNKYVLVDRFGCAKCRCVWEGDPYYHDAKYNTKRDDGLEYTYHS